MNILKIEGENVILEGFKKIKSNETTFAFYSKGVVIFLDKKEERNYYINVFIDKNNIIRNDKLLEKLKEKNINNIEYFIETKDSYIQMNPT